MGVDNNGDEARKSVPRNLPDSIPDTWDWRKEDESNGGVGVKCKAQIEKVYDQGLCGSCYVIAPVSAMADRQCIAKVCSGPLMSQ